MKRCAHEFMSNVVSIENRPLGPHYHETDYMQCCNCDHRINRGLVYGDNGFIDADKVLNNSISPNVNVSRLCGHDLYRMKLSGDELEKFDSVYKSMMELDKEWSSHWRLGEGKFDKSTNVETQACGCGIDFNTCESFFCEVREDISDKYHKTQEEYYSLVDKIHA